MNQPQPTPWMLARLRDAAEQILLEARELARQRDAIRDENALAIARDRDDAREEEQAVRALQEIQARRREQQARIPNGSHQIATLDAEAKRLENEAQQAYAYVTHHEQAGQVQPTVTLVDVLPEQDGGRP